MHIDWQIASISDWQADAILFFTLEDAPEPLPGFRRWLEESGAWLLQSMALKDFRSEFQEAAVYYGPLEARTTRVVQVGLGSLDKFNLDKLRGATVAGLRKCRELKLSSIAIPLSAFEGLPLATASALEEVLIAGALGLYRFDALKTREVETATYPERLVILAEEEPDETLRHVPFAADSVISGIELARDLVTAPSNQVTPGFIVSVARDLAEKHGFQLQIIDTKMAEEMGMRTFLAVAQGSREPAYVVILEHTPPGTERGCTADFCGERDHLRYRRDFS